MRGAWVICTALEVQDLASGAKAPQAAILLSRVNNVQKKPHPCKKRKDWSQIQRQRVPWRQIAAMVTERRPYVKGRGVDVKTLGGLVEYEMGINLIAVNAMLHEKVFYSSRRPQARTCRRVVIDEVAVRN
jgi:hypothetical protein